MDGRKLEGFDWLSETGAPPRRVGDSGVSLDRSRLGPLDVRVIEYRLEGIEGAEPFCRLVTTILYPGEAPAEELAALYSQHWEIESALDNLKTHLRGARIVLRGKTPELVRQEFYGLLLAHCAIPGLMHEAARRASAAESRDAPAARRQT
jgi:hypothetical protein